MVVVRCSDDQQWHPCRNWKGGSFAQAKNVKVNGYCEDRNEVFKYLGYFWHGFRCMPIRNKPIGRTEVTLLSRYKGTQTKLQK